MTLLGQFVKFLFSQSTVVFGTVHPELDAVHRNLTWDTESCMAAVL